MKNIPFLLQHVQNDNTEPLWYSEMPLENRDSIIRAMFCNIRRILSDMMHTAYHPQKMIELT